MTHRDGAQFLPAGFFDAYPDVEGERDRFAPLLRRLEGPLFLADTRIVADRYERLLRAQEELWGPAAVAYSFKTNYAVAGSRVLQGLGAWAEVVSGREYRLARSLGYDGDEIVFNGPYKRDDDLRDAVRDGALVNVNDLDELDRLLALADGDARIGLRIRPDTGSVPPSRFGLSLAGGEADEAIARLAAAGAGPAGVHLHLRGDTDDPATYRAAGREVAGFLRRHGAAIDVLDLGGGFPAHGPRPRSRERWNPRPIEEYVAALAGELAPVFDGRTRPLLVLEPGRYLVADAIVFVCEVLRVSPAPERQVVTVTGAVNMLPLTHYCPQIVRALAPSLRARNGTTEPSLVHGASCRENDVLYDGPLQRVAPGDLLVFYAAGAYNASLSPEFIFDAPPLLLA